MYTVSTPYGTRRVTCSYHKIHSFGLPGADPLPSAFVIDVEDDPVVDVCRRKDLRGRSPVLGWTGDTGVDFVDKPGARLKRGNRIFSVGVALAL